MENIIKEKFNNFEVAPSAGLFDAIVAKRKQKKRLIWIWSAASILLIGAAYLGFNSINQPTQNVNPIVEQESNSSDKQATNQLNEDETAAFNQTTELDAPFEEAPISIDQDYVQSPASNKVLSEGNPRPIKQTTPKIAQEVPQKVEEAPVKDKSLAEKFLEIVKSEKNNDIKKAKFFVKDKELVVDAPRKSVKTELPAIENDNSSDTKSDNNNSPANSGDKPDVTDPLDDDLGGENPKLSKWSIAITGGPGVGGRMLTGDQSMMDARTAAESSKLSYGFDFRTSYAFSPLWNIQTGINYTQRNENFNHVVTSTQVNTRKESKEITIIHPVLGEIKKEVEYTVSDTVHTSNATSANNKYTSVSVPLSIERMFLFGQKFAIMARTGIQFGINSSASGLTINQENDAVSMSTQPYKQAGVNRIELGIGAAYRVNNRLTILVYPQGNVALQSVYKKSAFVEQRDFGLYTQLGLKIDL